MPVPISSLIGGGGTITTYTESSVISTSQTVSVPVGTKRIEALVCGGGGAGSSGIIFSGAFGGGFGGLQIYEIPVVSTSLSVIVGAGGIGSADTSGASGGTTIVSANGTIYAAVGGGGGGAGAGARFGGSVGTTNPAVFSYPFNTRNLLWSALDFVVTTVTLSSAGMGGNEPAEPGVGGWFSSPSNNGGSAIGGVTGGGGAANTSNWASGFSGAGGSLTSVSVWGRTGFAGGAAAAVTGNGATGGGGGGFLGAGGHGTTSGNVGGAGGKGGGGGGAGQRASGIGGSGGNGFVIFRFYS